MLLCFGCECGDWIYPVSPLYSFISVVFLSLTWWHIYSSDRSIGFFCWLSDLDLCSFQVCSPGASNNACLHPSRAGHLPWHLTTSTVSLSLPPLMRSCMGYSIYLSHLRNPAKSPQRRPQRRPSMHLLHYIHPCSPAIFSL